MQVFIDPEANVVEIVATLINAMSNEQFTEILTRLNYPALVVLRDKISEHAARLEDMALDVRAILEP